MKGILARVIVAVLNAIPRRWRPRRTVKMSGGYYFLGRDAMWYIGPPDWQERRIGEEL